ncbi:MAG: FliI/YscN family ATPase [Acidimicrobiales bacterium]
MLGLSASPTMLREAARPVKTGTLMRVLGLHAEVAGIDVGIGDLVLMGDDRGPTEPVIGEVVALDETAATVLPYGHLRGRAVGETVRGLGRQLLAPVGHGLLGRVIDGQGNPIDGGPPLSVADRVPIHLDPPSAMDRPRVTEPLQVGVRAIDTMLSCGRGQRVGILAGSGVGKSSLLSMLLRGTEAPIKVLALVGERGREVREFLENDLGPEGRKEAVIIVATSDEPALVRRNAAFLATRIAEWFRDEGSDVMLLMDSLTRFAMAQREIGLSAGEVPTARGYTPSVFGLLPTLLERAGTSARGSITGFYTVLVEGDDLNDPIGDAARSILDGHISLSRRLANAGHFPSIDILASASRVAGGVNTVEQNQLAQDIRQAMAVFDEARDLIEVGAYSPGSSAEIDRAIALRPATTNFLQQPLHQLSDRNGAWQELAALLAAVGGPTG